MATPYHVAPALPGDLPRIAAIELAAAQLLVGHAPLAVLLQTTPRSELADARQDGRLWIARAGEQTVGFAHVAMLAPRSPHLLELDVHPDHGRRGLGTRLVAAVCAWVAARAYGGLTLTTFRDVPWNLPFYARLGFEAMPPGCLPATLEAQLDAEAARGLDRSRRVAMRWRAAPRTAAPVSAGSCPSATAPP